MTVETNGSSKPRPPALRGRQPQDGGVRARFLGCLLGGAVGDALGAPVEFMSHAGIRRRFGAQGITDYAPAYGGLGTITDDTQMTLFTAEGLLRSWVRGGFRGLRDPVGETSLAYLRWLRTQGGHPHRDIDPCGEEPGWLFLQQPLHSCRAPGSTCLAALREMTAPGEPARNDSKGCGAVMRVAPVGLLAWRLGRREAARDAFRLGVDLASLTHGHRTGTLSAGVLAVLIPALIDGASLPAALHASKTLLRAEAGHEETLQAMVMAEELAGSDLPHYEAVARLGRGWIAEEALALSIYCALVARDFRHGVTLAVNHDGDSDSTGAIAGNLLGLMHGVEAIPSAWLEALELREVIAEMAEDLCQFRDWAHAEASGNTAMLQRIRRKYPQASPITG
jgi:ADP-ribosylglycohydrolase